MIFSSNYHGAEPSEAWEDGGRFTKIPKIVKLNVRQQSGCRFLCATIYNAYQYMVVVVKTSMNLNQDIISAHCSFKIAETIGDCEFPALEPYILFTMRFQNLNMAPRRNFLQTSLQLCYCNHFYRRQLDNKCNLSCSAPSSDRKDSPKPSLKIGTANAKSILYLF